MDTELAIRMVPPPAPPAPPPLPDHLQNIADEARPYYERLRKYKL